MIGLGHVQCTGWGRKMAEALVTTDQLFYTIKEPEFYDLLMYTHHPSPKLKIPHHDTVKQRIIKMGTASIKAMKQMFQVHTS